MPVIGLGAQEPALAGGPFARAATDPVLQVYERSDLGSIDPRYGFPEENQTANGHSVVMYSGNDADYYSVDNGATFSYMSPETLFGAVDGGFCCDQVLRYAPSVNRFLLLMQGDCSGDCSGSNENRYELAVASPEDIKAAARAGRPVESAWHIYSLVANSMFHDTTWYDFPDLAVGSHALYLSWDRTDVGTMMARMSLRQIAGYGSASVFFWKKDRGGIFPRVAQASGDTGYFLNGDDHGDQSQADVYYTSADSPYLFSATLPHTPIPNRDWSSDTGFARPGVPGDDWANRASISGDAVRGATIGGPRRNQLWVAWSAGRGYSDTTTNAWSQPHIHYAVYSLPGFARLSEHDLYNTGYAMEFPYLNTDAAGDVGISFAYGGPHTSNRPAAGILLPENRGSGVNFFDVGVGDAINPFTIPAGVGLNRTQGDYTTIQPDGDNPSLFVTGGPFDRYATLGGVQIPQDHWEFMRFGYGQPLSPPSVRITAPPAGSVVSSDQTVSFHGIASDWSGTTIVATSQLQWVEDGVEFGRGPNASLTHPTVGFHTVTLNAVDGAGRIASASIRIQVTAPPAGGNPSVSIDSPAAGQNYPDPSHVPFAAHGTEASGATLAGADVDWTDTYTDEHGIVQHAELGRGLSFVHSLYYNGVSPTAHTITITATDPVNHHTATDSVQITVGVAS